MSRSIHHTTKSVFGGKSAEEISAMIKEGDEGVDALIKKHRYKKAKNEDRAVKKLLDKQDED